jgi:hypothetical protein
MDSWLFIRISDFPLLISGPQVAAGLSVRFTHKYSKGNPIGLSIRIPHNLWLAQNDTSMRHNLAGNKTPWQPTICNYYQLEHVQTAHGDACISRQLVNSSHGKAYQEWWYSRRKQPLIWYGYHASAENGYSVPVVFRLLILSCMYAKYFRDSRSWHHALKVA